MKVYSYTFYKEGMNVHTFEVCGVDDYCECLKVKNVNGWSEFFVRSLNYCLSGCSYTLPRHFLSLKVLKDSEVNKIRKAMKI